MVSLQPLARGLFLAAVMTSALALLSRVSTRAPDLTRELVEPPGGLVECVTPRERLETVTMSVC
jgi:hypothetical protein